MHRCSSPRVRPLLASRAMRGRPFGELLLPAAAGLLVLRRALPQRRLQRVPAVLDRDAPPSLVAAIGWALRPPTLSRPALVFFGAFAAFVLWQAVVDRAGRSSRPARGTTPTAASSTSRSRPSARCSAASPPRRLGYGAAVAARRALRLGARREGDPRRSTPTTAGSRACATRSATGTSSRCSAAASVPIGLWLARGAARARWRRAAALRRARRRRAHVLARRDRAVGARRDRVARASTSAASSRSACSRSRGSLGAARRGPRAAPAGRQRRRAVAQRARARRPAVRRSCSLVGARGRRARRCARRHARGDRTRRARASRAALGALVVAPCAASVGARGRPGRLGQRPLARVLEPVSAQLAEHARARRLHAARATAGAGGRRRGTRSPTIPRRERAPAPSG